MRAEDDSALSAESDPPARDDAEFRILAPRSANVDDVDDDGRERRSQLSRDVDGLRDRVRIIGGEVLARRYDLADRDLKVLSDIAAELRRKLAALGTSAERSSE